MSWRCLALVALLALTAGAEEKLRLCAQEDITTASCNALERQNSPMKCARVLDSADCAIQLSEGKADFGVFTADELLLAHNFYPTGLQVVAELRNRENTFDPFEFQSVVVVPKSYVASESGFGHLVGAGFCHPGFSKSQIWNDHVLKYFEQKVMNNVCRDELTVAENEIVNLRDFFKTACRPGEWVADDDLDKELKKKYPQMCQLCDDPVSCKYARLDSHGHTGALDCLTSGKGKVAYASLYYVKEYFAPNQASRKISDYRFLCENGTVVPLNVANPCTWFKQPWSVILAREDKASAVTAKLEQASNIKVFSTTWEESLNSILFRTDSPTIFKKYISPAHYLSRGRDVKLPTPKCYNIRWCTVNQLETNKCNWTSAAALTVGINPGISCVQAESPFECFDKISKTEADVITIDSNYGHLARKVYGLAPALFCDTSEALNSFVVAVIRETSSRRRITSLNDIKDSNACFPEYGGIAWLSFINVARDHGILPDSCKYPEIVAKLLKGACTPGFFEANHSQSNKTPKRKLDNLDKLCDLCPSQTNGERCEANSENSYYGDKGALDCLKMGVGDIAFLEAQNIQAFINNGSVNSSEYRVLCKNGSLAEYTGFNVDTTCAFSVTIDSEVVTRRNILDHKLQDISLALLKMEDWLGYRGSSERRAIHIYDPFNGTENLLFKQSTIGLVSDKSNIPTVHAYKELFRHVDSCSGAMTLVSGVLILVVNFIFTRHI